MASLQLARTRIVARMVVARDAVVSRSANQRNAQGRVTRALHFHATATDDGDVIDAEYVDVEEEKEEKKD